MVSGVTLSPSLQGFPAQPRPNLSTCFVIVVRMPNTTVDLLHPSLHLCHNTFLELQYEASWDAIQAEAGIMEGLCNLQ
jgi:hypothetical protein